MHAMTEMVNPDLILISPSLLELDSCSYFVSLDLSYFVHEHRYWSPLVSVYILVNLFVLQKVVSTVTVTVTVTGEMP